MPDLFKQKSEREVREEEKSHQTKTQKTKTPDRNSHKTKSWCEIKTVTKRVIIESDETRSERHVQEVSGVFWLFHST